MAKGTNAERVVAGEASTSSSSRRRKRQQLPSAADDEGDEVSRSGTLLDLDLLDCPVCFQALTEHVFQCDNGHIACSSCCLQLRNKCPACALPIGNNRCRIMERIVESVAVPCPNAKHGCTKKFSYGKELTHENECRFALCHCPAPNCNYAGVYKDLYAHYDANHMYTFNRFVCGTLHHLIYLRTISKVSVLQEHVNGPLVVLQCFEGPQGVLVAVNCIAPSAPGVGKFSFDLTYTVGQHTVRFGSTEMNRIQKVSLETPQDNFMFIPSYLVSPIIFKNLHICIRPLEDEEEVEEEAVEVDVGNSVRRSAREKKTNSRYQSKVK